MPIRCSNYVSVIPCGHPPSIACIDLFCGAGGLTCGLEQAGIDVVAGIDCDPACQYPYESNNKGQFHCDAIENVTARLVTGVWAGADITMLAACVPCQPFSTYTQHGKDLQSLEAPLLNAVQHLVQETKPDIIMMENVPPLLRVFRFTEFQRTLKSMGYWVCCGILNAADYGVPQVRKRLILLGSRLGQIRLPSPGYPIRHQTVRDAIASLPPIEAGEACPEDPLHQSCALSEVNLERIRASAPGGSWRNWPPQLVTSCHREQDRISWTDSYGRMDWQRPAPTITTRFLTYGCGRFGHPDQDRAISLREGALLQSFPPQYRLSPPKIGSKRVIARMIGNAVPPRLAAAIGMDVVRHAQKYS